METVVPLCLDLEARRECPEWSRTLDSLHLMEQQHRAVLDSTSSIAFSFSVAHLSWFQCEAFLVQLLQARQAVNTTLLLGFRAWIGAASREPDPQRNVAATAVFWAYAATGEMPQWAAANRRITGCKFTPTAADMGTSTATSTPQSLGLLSRIIGTRRADGAARPKGAEGTTTVVEEATEQPPAVPFECSTPMGAWARRWRVKFKEVAMHRRPLRLEGDTVPAPLRANAGTEDVVSVGAGTPSVDAPIPALTSALTPGGEWSARATYPLPLGGFVPVAPVAPVAPGVSLESLLYPTPPTVRTTTTEVASAGLGETGDAAGAEQQLLIPPAPVPALSSVPAKAALDTAPAPAPMLYMGTRVAPSVKLP